MGGKETFQNLDDSRDENSNFQPKMAPPDNPKIHSTDDENQLKHTQQISPIRKLK